MVVGRLGEALVVEREVATGDCVGVIPCCVEGRAVVTSWSWGCVGGMEIVVGGLVVGMEVTTGGSVGVTP